MHVEEAEQKIKSFSCENIFPPKKEKPILVNRKVA
jgi:hypothetical protein